jgi:anti-anti-sigma regulatory factor
MLAYVLPWAKQREPITLPMVASRSRNRKRVTRMVVLARSRGRTAQWHGACSDCVDQMRIFMMLRITLEKQASEERVLRLDGSIAGPWVAELRRICEQMLSGVGALMLDCGEVSFIDEQGALLTRSLIERGVSLVNCSPYMTERLKIVG